MRQSILAACMLAAAGLYPRPAAALEGEIATMRCGLFLDYIGTDPSDFEVFRAWLQGYAVAARGPGSVEQDANLMSSLVGYCKAHPDDTFTAASEFAAKKRAD